MNGRMNSKKNEGKMERKTKEQPLNKFDGIQLNEYRIWNSCEFIDKTFTNIEIIY